MKFQYCVLLFPLFAGCQQVKHLIKKPETSDTYINLQLKIIEAHKNELVKAGRITDPEHFSSELYLASYGWHSSCDPSDTRAGASGENAHALAISTGCDGSFGAYTFNKDAFEQAKRLYVIHGEMLAGTDILIDTSWGECIPEKDGGCIVGSSSGYTSPRAKGAFDAVAA